MRNIDLCRILQVRVAFPSRRCQMRSHCEWFAGGIEWVMAGAKHADRIKPWGELPPGPLLRFVISLTRNLPADAVGRWLASLLYRLVSWNLDGPVDSHFVGAKVRLHSDGNGAEILALFTPDMYAPEERRLLAGMQRPDFTMVDVGANVGLFSLFAAACMDESARIIAVEPDRELFRRLRFNIGASGTRTVTGQNLAISGDFDALVVMPESGGQPGDGTAVQGVTLVELMDQHGIDRLTVLNLGNTGQEFDTLSAFFIDAGRGRFPEVLMVMGQPSWPEADPVRLAEMHGYRVVESKGEKTILALSDIKASQTTESV